MTRPILPAVLLLILLGHSLAAGRTWTHRDGRQRVEAELESYGTGRVWLRRTDGVLFETPLADLSRDDQKYVEERMRADRAKVLVRTEPRPGDIAYGPARELCKLAGTRVGESSGQAASHARPGWLWTHNDSGDDSRLYLTDTQGRDLGSCRLADMPAYDWEDLASFQADGKNYLLVCDTGNNRRASAVQMIHIVEEPPLDPERGVTVAEVPIVRTIYYAYDDDHRDCEAVAVDPRDKTIWLATKEHGIGSHLYRLAWPPDDTPAMKCLVARRVATLALPEVTGMDISPDGRRAVLGTYGNAYEYVREADEEWPAAFARPPRELVLPARKQGESICYGADGKTLYLTSEQLPTPLFEVPVAAEGK